MSAIKMVQQHNRPLFETIETLLMIAWAGKNPGLLTDIPKSCPGVVNSYRGRYGYGHQLLIHVTTTPMKQPKPAAISVLPTGSFQTRAKHVRKPL